MQHARSFERKKTEFFEAVLLADLAPDDEDDEVVISMKANLKLIIARIALELRNTGFLLGYLRMIQENKRRIAAEIAAELADELAAELESRTSESDRSVSPEYTQPKETPEEEFDSWVIHFKYQSCRKPLLQAPAGLPSTFSSSAEYTSTLRPLVLHECDAQLATAWKKLIDKETKEIIAQVNVRPLQSTFFCFLDVKGMMLDMGDTVLVGEENVLAIVSEVWKDSVMLRTNRDCGIKNAQYPVWRICNVMTLRRIYVAVSRVPELTVCIQEQILNPALGRADWIQSSVETKVALRESKSWFMNKTFSRQQKLAILGAMRSPRGFHLVQGPPGTGKTTTVIGMVWAILDNHPGARILVAAPSNAALDEIVIRLINGKEGQYVTLEGRMVRLGPPKSVNPECASVTLFGIRSYQSGKQDDAAIIKAADVVCSTLSCCGHRTLDESKAQFDFVIIDEAAQAPEAEALIALRRANLCCILVGDPCQLPATVFQNPAIFYGRSLFERMQDAGAYVHVLDTQYRMHSEVSEFPLRTFYHGMIKNGAVVEAMKPVFSDAACSKGVKVNGLRFQLGSYRFFNLKGSADQKEEGGTSRFNEMEAKAVISLIRAVLENVVDQTLEIGVVTPYSAQKSEILSHMNEEEAKVCEINTVDGFQGREKDIIIISCVRAGEGGLGFVSDRKRMNVALTRGRHAVLIIGCAESLAKQSADWDALIRDSSERHAYQVVGESSKRKRKAAPKE